MFDLDCAIGKWREQMSASGIESRETLVELENHLRDQIRDLTLSGMAESSAFEMAISRVGSAELLMAEFRKTGQGFELLKSGWLPAACGIGLLAAVLLGTGRSGRADFLLLGHVLSLTAGYCAALLGGGMGIYFVCRRFLGTFQASHQHAIARAVSVLSPLAAACVSCGLLLGMIWSGKHLGQYLGADPREVAGLCAGIWLAGAWAIQRFGNLELRAVMLLSIAGSGMVSIAWFGAWALAHGYGLSGLSPVAVVLAIQTLFFAAGLVPTHVQSKPEQKSLCSTLKMR